ncbi:hypothetical protein CALCODRAFT_545831 [Calocera cornea HHB12733]|uniref:DUF6532 domain-containing protein n=1 Tax=Calocera cornea HHB12733 TaxID=1353952 RepID=A0A165JEW5_9BASI|nr:hypothetical protein CALCODRAFT_545831 [Calocera cornea HHB12733]
MATETGLLDDEPTCSEQFLYSLPSRYQPTGVHPTLPGELHAILQKTRLRALTALSTIEADPALRAHAKRLGMRAVERAPGGVSVQNAVRHQGAFYVIADRISWAYRPLLCGKATDNEPRYPRYLDLNVRHYHPRDDESNKSLSGGKSAEKYLRLVNDYVGTVDTFFKGFQQMMNDTTFDIPKAVGPAERLLACASSLYEYAGTVNALGNLFLLAAVLRALPEMSTDGYGSPILPGYLYRLGGSRSPANVLRGLHLCSALSVIALLSSCNIYKDSCPIHLLWERVQEFGHVFPIDPHDPNSVGFLAVEQFILRIIANITTDADIQDPARLASRLRKWLAQWEELKTHFLPIPDKTTVRAPLIPASLPTDTESTYPPSFDCEESDVPVPNGRVALADPAPSSPPQTGVDQVLVPSMISAHADLLLNLEPQDIPFADDDVTIVDGGPLSTSKAAAEATTTPASTTTDGGKIKRKRKRHAPKPSPDMPAPSPPPSPKSKRTRFDSTIKVQEDDRAIQQLPGSLDRATAEDGSVQNDEDASACADDNDPEVHEVVDGPAASMQADDPPLTANNRPSRVTVNRLQTPGPNGLEVAHPADPFPRTATPMLTTKRLQELAAIPVNPEHPDRYIALLKESRNDLLAQVDEVETGDTDTDDETEPSVLVSQLKGIKTHKDTGFEEVKFGHQLPGRARSHAKKMAQFVKLAPSPSDGSDSEWPARPFRPVDGPVWYYTRAHINQMNDGELLDDFAYHSLVVKADEDEPWDSRPWDRIRLLCKTRDMKISRRAQGSALPIPGLDKLASSTHAYEAIAHLEGVYPDIPLSATASEIIETKGAYHAWKQTLAGYCTAMHIVNGSRLVIQYSRSIENKLDHDVDNYVNDVLRPGGYDDVWGIPLETGDVLFQGAGTVYASFAREHSVVSTTNFFAATQIGIQIRSRPEMHSVDYIGWKKRPVALQQRPYSHSYTSLDSLSQAMMDVMEHDNTQSMELSPDSDEAKRAEDTAMMPLNNTDRRCEMDEDSSVESLITPVSAAQEDTQPTNPLLRVRLALAKSGPVRAFFHGTRTIVSSDDSVLVEQRFAQGPATSLSTDPVDDSEDEMPVSHDELQSKRERDEKDLYRPSKTDDQYDHDQGEQAGLEPQAYEQDEQGEPEGESDTDDAGLEQFFEELRGFDAQQEPSPLNQCFPTPGALSGAPPRTKALLMRKAQKRGRKDGTCANGDSELELALVVAMSQEQLITRQRERASARRLEKTLPNTDSSVGPVADPRNDLHMVPGVQPHLLRAYKTAMKQTLIDAKAIMRVLIAVKHPYPSKSEELEVIKLAASGANQRAKKRNPVDPALIDFARYPGQKKVIGNIPSWLRSQIKDKAEKAVPVCYRFAIEGEPEETRARVAWLLEDFTFCYRTATAYKPDMKREGVFDQLLENLEEYRIRQPGKCKEMQVTLTTKSSTLLNKGVPDVYRSERFAKQKKGKMFLSFEDDE